MYRIISEITTNIVCKLLFHVRYENEQILNRFDKCIICPNHSRIFDPVFLKPVVPDMYSMAKSELFKHKFFSKLLKYNNAFPINREKTDIRGVKTAIDLLDENEKIKLLIFPEGKVVKTKEEIGKIKSGAIHISAVTNIPIIPVSITQRPKFFSKVTVKFGRPFIPDEQAKNNKKILKQEANKLLKQIYE